MVFQAKNPARDALTPLLYNIISCVFGILNYFIRLISISLHRPCLILHRPCFILHRPCLIPRISNNAMARSFDKIFGRFRIISNIFVSIDVTRFLEWFQDICFHFRDSWGGLVRKPENNKDEKQCFSPKLPAA